MSITLGHRLIGKDAAAKQQAALSDNEGGGAIQLGSRLFTKRRPQAVVAAAAALVAAVPPETSVPRVTGNKVPRTEPVVVAVPPKDGDLLMLSEQNVEEMLALDPNMWDKVCEAEMQRPEGWRPAVAHMVLNAAPEAKDKPVPQPILDVLHAAVERANAADVATFTKAQADAAAAAEAAGPPQE